MKRHELEHLIRSAGAISSVNNVLIIGSQSILGQYPNAPTELLRSMEADIAIPDSPGAWNLIDGVLGEDSAFHETFGYYADGVEESTAKLPENWKSRLVEINNPNTNGITGLCLEAHDLATSKIIAGRDKDLEFVSNMVLFEMLNEETMVERIKSVPVDDEIIAISVSRISRIFSENQNQNDSMSPS